MADRETLVGRAELSQDIRKSRFIAIAAPVGDAEQALAFIAESSDASATHNCWAWRIGQNYRSSDDGEPGGTAGRPILQAIDGQGLDGVAVVVTRWYGGIKLGAGGLIRAYGGCAAECLRRAPRIVLVERIEVDVECEFAVLPTLLTHLPDHQANADTPRPGADRVTLRVTLPPSRLDGFQRYLADLSRGRARVLRVQTPEK